MLLGISSKVKARGWRKHKSVMQVVSGTISKEKIYFEAPPFNQIPKEMDLFINWFNDTAAGMKNEIRIVPIRPAIAHIYF
jgi:hypothetical protein